MLSDNQRTYLRPVLTAVAQMVKRGDVPGNHGICGLASWALKAGDYTGLECQVIKADLCKLMRQWPDYSGDSVYPIPSFDPSVSHGRYFHDEQKVGRLWANTPYGIARRALLAWCLDQVAR